jgi:hypothetical protein
VRVRVLSFVPRRLVARELGGLTKHLDERVLGEALPDVTDDRRGETRPIGTQIRRTFRPILGAPLQTCEARAPWHESCEPTVESGGTRR